MTGRAEQESPQIRFRFELARKATHMGALAIPAGYYVLGLSKVEALSILVPLTLLVIATDISRLRGWWLWRSVARPMFGSMVRHHELNGDFTGATYILLSTCFTIGLFSKPIAIAALSFIIVGDTCAALVGRKFGRHKFGRKSLEGSLACLVGTVIVALVAPNLALTVGLLGALTATLTEAFSVRIDDNISVPIVSGLIMTLSLKIFNTTLVLGGTPGSWGV